MRVFLLFIQLILAYPAAAADFDVRIPADVVSVYDGDTLTVDAHPWPGMIVRTGVRVLGIDTPEMRGRCESEKQAARHARNRLRELAKGRVQLKNIAFGKYAGRVIAEVMTESGSVGYILIQEGLARPYYGGKREGWCR